MAELEEKLNAILGDPNAMGQIMALARSLGGGGGTGEPNSPPPEPREERRAAPDRPLQLVGVTRLLRAALDTMGGKGEEGRV